MDLKGSLVDTNLKIYPSKALLEFLENITITGDTPTNVLKFSKNNKNQKSPDKNKKKGFTVSKTQITEADILLINKIKETVIIDEPKLNSENCSEDDQDTKDEEATQNCNKIKNDSSKSKAEDFAEPIKLEDIDHSDKNSKPKEESDKEELPYLGTSDIDWIYSYIKTNKSKNYLHELLKGCTIKPPENEVIKRNPVLEARCVKLRAQQEAREYRKMTKSVDNVRINYPEDSIAYQMKQMNRQLIAIGQFIISIFAGFLFGFRGVEWMVGYLDFGFRLLLGVMCALIIALAEIYFLAKKLNEELNAAETTQIGGPPKFGDEIKYEAKVVETIGDKEHQD